MHHRWSGLAVLAVIGGVLLLPAAAVRAQEQGEDAPQRGQFAGMQRVAGEVTTVSGSTLTVKGTDGVAYQVVTTDNTRVMKRAGGSGAGGGGRDNGVPPVTMKISEVKVGDGVMAGGNLDAPNKTLHAAFVGVQDAAEVKKLKDNLGKTYIVGKVTAIDLDNAKMTLQRPDGASQTIGFDEGTSFKRGRPGRGGAADASPTPSSESITLADIKVGDNVGGQGSVKGGVFVPAVLTVGAPGQGRRRGDAPGTTPATPPGPGD